MAREAGYPEGIGGLQAWAAQHGWEVADDGRLATHWATRFHFSAEALTRPLVAARGWVHGRDAMILFYLLGSENNTRWQTIIVVDADANYPVTAVVRRRRASSQDYGSPITLESIEFERRWRAMGWDAAGSHAVFTPRVIERLLEPTPGVSRRLSGTAPAFVRRTPGSSPIRCSWSRACCCWPTSRVSRPPTR